MTLEEKYKKTNDSTYNDRILKAIRQNLNKYKFKTQEEILIFLEKFAKKNLEGDSGSAADECSYLFKRVF